jgi:hypothetical protein
MSTQPEALRLADLIDHGSTSTQIERETAAELRRLHDVELHLAQVERGFDKLITQRDALHSVNAELLEALKWMVANDDTNEGDDPVERLGGQSWNEYNSYWLDGLNKARAAIAKATGETK